MQTRDNILKVFGSVCKELRLLGDKDLLDKALCAFAAVTDVERPRIDLSYSYVMRELRKEKDNDKIKLFQKTFKDTFEKALLNNLKNPDNIALMAAIKIIDFEE
jgi:hypothetical protein